MLQYINICVSVSEGITFDLIKIGGRKKNQLTPTIFLFVSMHFIKIHNNK